MPYVSKDDILYTCGTLVHTAEFLKGLLVFSENPDFQEELKGHIGHLFMRKNYLFERYLPEYVEAVKRGSG